MSGETQKRFPEALEDQREFFDTLITEEWESYQNPAWDASRRFEVATILDKLPTEPAAVLDVGCGCGFHDPLLAARPGTRRVLGVDYSSESIRKAESAYPHPKVSRRTVDVMGAEFEALGEFDLVTSFQVIEHLKNGKEFVEACAGRLAPQGRLAIATPNRRRGINRVLTLLGRPEALCDPQHYREYTVAELAEMGRSVGLRVVDHFGYGFSLPIPKLRRHLLTPGIRLRLGHLLPAAADVIVVIFASADSA